MRVASVLLALAAFAAAQERYALDVRRAPGEGRLTGKLAFDVPRSRWHHGVYETALRHRYEFSRDLCRTLVPKFPTAVGARWRPELAASSDFARAIVDSCRADPKDPARWTKWTGSGLKVSRRNAGGRLDATLTSVTDGLATIDFKGRIWVADSGRARSRYGPNWYDVRWLIPVKGSLRIALPEQTVHSFVVRSDNATASGAYYNQGGRTMRERFRATMTFVAKLVPLPDAKQAARARALIADLRANDAVLRTLAFRTLAKMPYNITPLLRRWRHDPDTEVRHAIVNLLRYRGGRP